MRNKTQCWFRDYALVTLPDTSHFLDVFLGD